MAPQYYEWKPIRRGDPVPAGAVFAGTTRTDGSVYVARAGRGGQWECGKMNMRDGRMWNIWCHDIGNSEYGDILVIHGDAQAVSTWVYVRRGDPLPEGAVSGGSNEKDGENFVCRSADGEPGKVNLKEDRLFKNFRYHTHLLPKGDGEILRVLGGQAPAWYPSVNYEWRRIVRGDPIPDGAVWPGRTFTDGHVCVARGGADSVDGFAAGGKLNLHEGKMWSIFCRGRGRYLEGEVLVLPPGTTTSWVFARRGSLLPDGALLVGGKGTSGENYVCRGSGGECGMATLEADRRIKDFLFHSYWFTRGYGEILRVFPADPTSSEAAPLPAAFRQPTPTAPALQSDVVQAPEVQPPHAQAQAQAEAPMWRPDADCNGESAEQRASRLMENYGLCKSAAQIQVMEEFPLAFQAVPAAG
eukprot:CAMPEP_0170229704 /NCGR_PEP_ID=MMETSP0116_2-20130129/14578_1 /TAXON_ID=400756 /ORGANISM="Durinskia baltica, Strain CSIRO CS-38" /LENGTH=412 /DNA_ID=CAMNT_0010480459 /DNA_START=72 /DNA_END=1310 /DNA_ORIENTATION=-